VRGFKMVGRLLRPSNAEYGSRKRSREHVLVASCQFIARRGHAAVVCMRSGRGDATVERADRDWRQYLVPAVAQFVVWGVEPIGSVDQGKADWLLQALALARRKPPRPSYEMW
jgi:hypothetical protein